MYCVTDDTIVAVASSPGYAPRGIVRLSGPRAVEIVEGLFEATDRTPLSVRPGFCFVTGMVRLEGAGRLPAEVYLFRAPRSYTRQDCVEIHTIGSPAVLAMVIEAALSAGARPAQPGEFTARAFVAGAMDLSQAEAVAVAINARGDAQLRAARKMREGEVARRVIEWRDALAELTALVEAGIDFAEEPVEFITPDVLRLRLSELADRMETLRANAASAERFDVLPAVLLLGRPNVGKSSLLNALSGLDRAICSAVAGTTRDILSAPIRVGAIEAMLLDAAGLHDDADELMREAQRLALSAAEHVDLLCLVVDLTEPPDASAFDCLRSTPATPCVLAANKIDQVDDTTRDRRIALLAESAPPNVAAFCLVSARTGAGLDGLRGAIAQHLDDRDDLGEDKAVVLSIRQRACLENAAAAVQRAIGEAGTTDRADLLALELREALDALGELTGEVTTEDLLGTIFASFCIGK